MSLFAGKSKYANLRGNGLYPSDSLCIMSDDKTAVNQRWKLQPMETAREYVQLSRRKRELDRELSGIKQQLELLEPAILELMEAEQLPESFKLDGARVFTRETTWASPLDGDHGALAHVLNELGLVEYLPRTVNSHSISAYVREHINPETGELEGIDERLVSRLKITRQTKAVVTG